MGAETGCAPEAALGEPVTEVAAPEGYRLWSSGYDCSANPLLALEMRAIRKRLGPLSGLRLVDVACGTGRWMSYAAVRGASVIGLDLSPDMLSFAAGKASLTGCVAVADMRAIPLANRAADLAMCSFGLGYLDSIAGAMAEMARIARRVIVSDLHPAAVAAGWSRSFRAGTRVYEIRSYSHAFDALDDAARAVGFELHWETEAHFGEPERALFQAAGKEDRFLSAQQIPAIFARCWGRP